MKFLWRWLDYCDVTCTYICRMQSVQYFCLLFHHLPSA